MTNAQIAEKFAKKQTGFFQSDHMLLRDETVYSYGLHFPVAKWNGEIVLFTTRDYSRTTCKHKYEVWAALLKLPDISQRIIRVRNVRPENVLDHGLNVDCIHADIKRMEAKANKARKHAGTYWDEVKRLRTELIMYASLFRVEI